VTPGAALAEAAAAAAICGLAAASALQATAESARSLAAVRAEARALRAARNALEHAVVVPCAPSVACAAPLRCRLRRRRIGRAPDGTPLEAVTATARIDGRPPVRLRAVVRAPCGGA